MEQGSPTRSAIEQAKQSYYEQLLSQQYNAVGMPYYFSASQLPQPQPQPQLDKQQIFMEAEELPSYLGQQIGPSFSRSPVFVPHGQQTYSMPNMMLQPPVPFGPIGMNVPSGFSTLATGGSNYAETSRLKRKMICQDDNDFVPIPQSWNSFSVADQGCCSTSYGSTANGGGNSIARFGTTQPAAATPYRYALYDAKYQALGHPVDPHLRMFNAIYGTGTNYGST